MEEKYPLFTVIIPQKNRAEFLGHTLRNCMIQDYPNFEVIVGDDCSDDNSVEVVRELQKIDSRIKLIAHEQHVGMHDNFEITLNRVRPGYVMALGGDDALTPGCIWKMYEIFQKTGRQLLTWPISGYEYPSDEGGNGTFFVRRSKNNNIRIIKSEDFLNQIAKTFRYLTDLCPMFYVKGVASTELVNRVKARTPDGSFYYCPTPDGYSGVVLAGEVEDYVYSPEPLSLSGMTKKSQGRIYHMTDEKSRQEAQQFFNDNVRRTMHEQLASQPYSPLITLMTADYLLTAHDLPGWPGKFRMFSIEELLRRTFAFIGHSSFQKDTLSRELSILYEIAKQHHLERLFDELYNSTVLYRREPKPMSGMVITNSIRFEGKPLNINNIFDASIATPFVYNFYQKVSVKELWRLIKNEIIVLVSKRKGFKKESLSKVSFQK